MQLTELVQITIIIFSLMILFIALISYTGYKTKNKTKIQENDFLPEVVKITVTDNKMNVHSEKITKVNKQKVDDKFKIFVLPDSQQLTRMNSKPKHYPHLIKIK